jgi:signal transduction histidine kinase/CheY-like chemotaxis protein
MEPNPHTTGPINIDTAQTLDATLHQILNQALVLVGTDAGSLMLVDTDQGILQVKARLGKPRPKREAELTYQLKDNTIASLVARTGKSYLCNDVESDTHFGESRSGRNFYSLLSVPIIHKEKVIAVINADAATKDFFTEEHVKRLTAVAEQVAEPLDEHKSLLDALADIGYDLTRMPRAGGVNAVLQKIVDYAVRSLGADVVTLYQYDSTKDEFLVEGTGPTIAGTLRDKRFMARKIHPGDVPFTLVKDRHSVFCPTVENQPFLKDPVLRLNEPERDRFVKREGIQSMAALLLPYKAEQLKKEEVVGVMFVNYRRKHNFNIDEMRALATFANYAAVAILNARHEEQRHIDQLELTITLTMSFVHRINNLAGASKVAAQLLHKRIVNRDEFIDRQLNRIEEETKMLQNLSERLRNYYMRSSDYYKTNQSPIYPLELRLTSLDLNVIIKEAIFSFSSSTVKITYNIHSKLPKISSDDFLLMQVLHDILKNAIQATANQTDGDISIYAEFNNTTKQVEVTITDNGPGMPTAIRTNPFRPLSPKPEEGRMGIGLWYSKIFMRATGGDLVLQDPQPEKGTSLILKIPSVTSAINDYTEYLDRDTTLSGVGLLDESASQDAGGASAGALRPAASQAAPPNITPKNLPVKGDTIDVLIVEDLPTWQNLLRDIIYSISPHYTVNVASNYEEATKSLGTYQYKLAIIDVRLVDFDDDNHDGIRLLNDIRDAELDTKVIMLTGFTLKEQEQEAKKNPHLIEFLHKAEVDTQQLSPIVHGVLD